MKDQILALGWMTLNYSLAETVLTNCVLELIRSENRKAAEIVLGSMTFSAKADAVRGIFRTGAFCVKAESTSVTELEKSINALGDAVARRNSVVHSHVEPNLDRMTLVNIKRQVKIDASEAELRDIGNKLGECSLKVSHALSRVLHEAYAKTEQS